MSALSEKGQLMKSFQFFFLSCLITYSHAQAESDCKNCDEPSRVLVKKVGSHNSKSEKKREDERNKTSEQGIYVDVKKSSQILFLATAKMMGISSEVSGKFSDFDVVVDKKADAKDSSVSVSISVKSIDTDNARRDRHLKKPDFFDEKKFPNITFKSKKIRHLKDEQYQINGDLKIKDKINNITFTVLAKRSPSSGGWQVTGETKLDRNDVGITYESPFYLPDVGNEIKMTFAIQLKPKQQ
jgi:polyisoprenoid-binding protein YceI